MPEYGPPRAPAKTVRCEQHGISWTDDYAWLRDPRYPTVEDRKILDYLRAENDWFEQWMAPEREFVDDLHVELKNRIEDESESVPVPDTGFEYRWLFRSGSQYRIWQRRRLDSTEYDTVIDEPEMAQSNEYFNLGGLSVDDTSTYVAYSTDTDGSERYKIRIREIESQTDSDFLLTDTSGTTFWSADGNWLFYVELNENLRPFRVRACHTDRASNRAKTVFEENDPSFFVSIDRTSDRKFLIIYTGDHVTREAYFLSLSTPEAGATCLCPRRTKHRYSVDHAHGRFYILTNNNHVNFRLVEAEDNNPIEAEWRELISGTDEILISNHMCFAEFIALSIREHGQRQIVVWHYDGSQHTVDFGADVFVATIGDNREFNTRCLRLGFSSPVHPAKILDYDVGERRLTCRKTQIVPSGFEGGHYACDRAWFESHDGARVPATIMHRKDIAQDGTGPIFLTGYGAYGIASDPHFSTHRLSLLDRGFVCAIAHVRGGSDLGQVWYDDGKLAKKTNTFDDFVAVAEGLIDQGYGGKGRVAISGGSAGGMLVGAALNMRPDLWGAAVAQVPFVDVLNTMLDASLPLTPIEWPEWGNPGNDLAAFKRIMAYSPYENVHSRDYPPIMVTAGISDPRVTYWEPAKWVAKLRATKTDDKPLLLKTNMGAGHFGASGRYDALKELAEVYTFILKAMDLPREPLP